MGDAYAISGLDAIASWRSNLDRGPRDLWKVPELGPFSMEPESIVLLGAQPGAGKTSLALAFTVGVLMQRADLHAVIMNCEMPTGALLDRVMANLAGVDAGRLRGRTLAYDDRRRVDQAIEQHAGMLGRLRFVGPPHTVERLALASMDAGARLVVCDYLQMINQGEHTTAKARVDITCSELRELTEMTGAGVLLVSALSRSKSLMGTSEYNLDAGIASFKESGSAEYSADSAWLMAPVSHDEGGMTIRLANVKNRYGTLSDGFLRFDGALQRFQVTDAPKAKQRASSKGTARNVLGERDE